MNDSSCVFEIIEKTVSTSENRLSISSLCKMAGVSRSGYYAWVKAEAFRQAQQEQDRKDFELILAAYKRRGYKKGARSIYLELLHMDPPVIMEENPSSDEKVPPALPHQEGESLSAAGESPEDQYGGR